MKHIVYLALLSCVVIDASAVPSKLHGKTPFVITSVTAANASMADDILKLINEYRKRKGLRAFAMSSVMNAEALKHSENMAARRTSFSHNGFQGRIKRISSSLNGVSNAAENVAMGSTSAKQVVEQWLSSPMHKKNIEGPYSLTGIGIAADKKGVLYYTQIFVTN